jgi:anti-sigma regulatory factor (Ser/Thr protein kinase)
MGASLRGVGHGYRHAATFYAGEESFLGQLAPFIRAGVHQDEPALVVLSAHKIDALRKALGDDTNGVEFADMNEVGANPARIIPAWQDFVEAHPGRKLRGIGEPIFPERGAAELTECQHHERLLNPALEDSELFLVCPYDTQALPSDVIDEARVSHPLIHSAGLEYLSEDYNPRGAAGGFFGDPLPEPLDVSEWVSYDLNTLSAARAFVRHEARRAGLSADRTTKLVLAAGEFTTNSVRHGGGSGQLRFWSEDGRVVCEVRDQGRIDDPLADRQRPREGQIGGWGLWIANQVCDLVQLRSLQAGVVARLHMQIH